MEAGLTVSMDFLGVEASIVGSPDNAPMKQQGAVARRDDARSYGHMRSAGSGAAITLPLMALHATALAWAVWTHLLPWWILPAWFFLNLLTFFVYRRDKHAAGKGAWRTSESTLHLWSLAGGWPGAWCAQQVLRHKSRKQPFRAVYWATVALHCAALTGWLYR
jgi:uncharacterized membrane protein YsdA (DUF1294 family)